MNILDMMSISYRQLVNLNSAYNENGKTRVIPKVPDFIMCAINRNVAYNTGILVNAEEGITIDKPIKFNIDNSNDVLYICVLTNTKEPIIDSVPIYSSTKDSSGFGTGYILCIPDLLFESDDYKAAINILKKIYFGILEFDNAIKFKPSAAVVRLHESKKVFVDSYSLMTCMVAILFIILNAKSWFYDAESDVEGAKIGVKKILDSFSEKELNEDTKERLIRVFNSYNSFDDIKNGIANGRLMNLFMYAKK